MKLTKELGDTDPQLKKFINDVIASNYDVDIKGFKVIAWGYQTLSLYMTDTTNTEYLIKVSPKSQEKIRKLEKAIAVENALHNTLKTPLFLKNRSGEFVTSKDKLVVVLQEFIHGSQVFIMDWNIFKQGIESLNQIHTFPKLSTKLENLNYKSLLKEVVPELKKNVGLNDFMRQLSDKFVLLHGDLTPANILVQNGKISGVIDFEECMYGPAEYDLSRFAVFTTFHMEEQNLEVYLAEIKKIYKGTLSDVTFYLTALFHLKQRLRSLQKHKKDYEDLSYWKMDYMFTDFKIQKLLNLISTLYPAQSEAQA